MSTSDTIKQAGRSAADAISHIGPVRAGLRSLSKSHLLPHSVWARLPVSETFEVEVGSSHFQYASVPGDPLGRALYWKGLPAFEGETIAEFCRFAATARMTIDVGACTGLYALIALALNPQAKAMAFEPVAANYECAKRNLQVNGWEERCDLRQECVSDRCGTAEFSVASGTEGAIVTSSSLNPNGFRGLPGQLVKINCTTLDVAVAPGTPVDLVKIDVEGFEADVLRGMQRVVAENSPHIIMEYSDETSPVAGEILDQYGYDIFHLRESGPMRVETFAFDNNFKNYLAKPRAKNGRARAASRS
jgi:FkbM family methyltransferase